MEGAQGGARFITRGAMIGAASAGLVTWTPRGDEIAQLRPAVAQAAEELAALKDAGAASTSRSGAPFADGGEAEATRGPAKSELDGGRTPSAKLRRDSRRKRE